MPAGCASVWGIDDGLPYGDASQDGTTAPDVTTPDSGGEGSSGDDAGDATVDVVADTSSGDVQDAGDASDAPCTPDLNWCVTHCGSGPDNCGIQVGCGGCGGGLACVNNVCGCASDPNYCQNRCGNLNDNCDAGVACGNCADGGTCSGGNCSGCVPVSDTTACGPQPCGTTKNNCGQTAYCGNHGSCVSPGDICKPDNTCCTPDNSACGTTFACGGGFTNNCGQPITCPGCGSGQVCFNSTCCIPESDTVACGNACNITVTNNCGQKVTCPSTCPPPNQCVGSQCQCVPVNNCGNSCNISVNNGCGQFVPCNCTSGECDPQSNTCCMVSGCSGPCKDNCHVNAPQCCPPDGGSDGGACSTPPQACGSGCCPGSKCVTGFCQPCAPPGSLCQHGTDCCSGSCSNGQAPFAGPDGGLGGDSGGPGDATTGGTCN